MLISRVLSRIPKTALSKLETRRSFAILSNATHFHHGSSRQTSILDNSALASAFQRRAVSSSTFPGREKEKEERQMSVVSLMSSKTEDETLYPGMSYVENQLRWGFIRKVYGIVGAQMILTAIVSSSIVHHAPLINFIEAHPFVSMLCSGITSFGLSQLLSAYQHKRPVNFLLLGLLTTSISVPIGAICAMTDSNAIQEALVLTASMVASLTGYTFWASKMGKDFNYLGPYLFSGLNVFLITMLVQIFFPFLLTPSAFFGAFGAMLFSGFIVYDTDNLIKRFTYDEYIPASLNLYSDACNLFVSILDAMMDMKLDDGE